MQTNKALRRKLAHITDLVNVLYQTPTNESADLISLLYHKVHEDDGPIRGVPQPREEQPAQAVDRFIRFVNAPVPNVGYMPVQAVPLRPRDRNGNQ